MTLFGTSLSYPHLKFTIILLKISAYVFPVVTLLVGIMQTIKFKNIFILGSVILSSFLLYLVFMIAQELLSMLLTAKEELKKIAGE